MADIKISQLPVAGSVTTADIAVINQGGTTKTASIDLIRGAVSSGTVTSVSGGTGLTGGTITTSGTLAVNFGTLAGTVTEGNDSRLSNSRPPTTHASSHAAGGSDPITPASIGAASTAQLAAYATTAQLAGYTPTTRTVSAGTGLTGGGDLSADRTLSLSDVGTAGTYGSASAVPVVTTNAKGQVSAVSTQQIAILGSQVSGNISGNSANVTGIVAIANGGTGAIEATMARTNLSGAKSGANTDITSVALTTGTISTTPTASTDIANKAYADSIGSGINFHDACDYATIAPLSPSANYNQPGGAGVGVNATLTGSTNVALQVDGTTVSVGQRILVKSQASQFQNGVYTVTQQGDGSTQPYILTRATDYDTSGSAPNEVQAGDFILVLNGSIANTAWVQQTPAPIVFGSSNIVFIQFAAASAAYLAGTGLSLSNNTFSITTTGVANFTAGSASAIPVITTNTQGQITNLTTAQVTPSAIGAVATADLTQLATAGKVPQLNGSGLISTSQIPALTPAQIAQITPAGIGAVATSDLTQLATAGKVPQLDGSGFLSTAQLADIAGLPVGAVGSSTVVPVITTDTKGRITNLTTAQITGGGATGVTSFSAGLTGLTPNTATTGVVTLAGTLGVGYGGTGATTQQAALNALAGSVTSGQYLRGNGTNVSMSSLQSSDLSGTIAIANGGTGASTQQGALNAIAGSQTAGYHFRSDGTNVSLQPMSAADVTAGTLAVANGGTGAANLQDARVSMGGIQLIDHNIITQITGTMNTSVTPNVLTYDSNIVLTIDSIAPSVGDTVFVSGQFSTNTPNTAAHGPWIITQVGTASQPTILTRPSWFSGTVKNNFPCAIRYGNTNAGIIRIAMGPVTTGTKTDITVGTSLINSVLAIGRSNTATIAGNTYTGRQTLAANTGSVNPISFQNSTTQLSSLTPNALEYISDALFITNNAATVRSQLATLSGANTWSAAQVFSSSATFNGGSVFSTPPLLAAGATFPANTASVSTMSLTNSTTVNNPIKPNSIEYVNGNLYISNNSGARNQVIDTAYINGTRFASTLKPIANSTSVAPIQFADSSTYVTNPTTFPGGLEYVNGKLSLLPGSSTRSHIPCLEDVFGNFVSVVVDAAISVTSASANSITCTVGVGIGGVASADGYTFVLGDTVLLRGQSAAAQNGPWIITLLGTALVSATLVRPNWFNSNTTNVVKNGILACVLYGTTNFAKYYNISGPSGAAITLGTTALTVTEGTSRIPAFTSIPSTSTSSGVKNQMAIDDTNNWLYVCTATNIWKRIALTTF